MQTDSSQFAFRFCSPQGRHQESYLPGPRLYKNVDKNWNINVSFIIHVNFDHAWVEHYPVTLMNAQNKDQAQIIPALKQYVDGRINETIEHPRHAH